MLRLLSTALCLVAVAWFATFALEQSKSASAHQQAEVNASGPPSLAMPVQTDARPSKSTFRDGVDKAFAKISSPFSGITKGIASQWTLHAVNTMLALLIYGLGLGYLARALRLRSR